eukprot:scaffold23510_cov115-Cylindrotheca_fusiformis.AAC.3
MMQRCSSSPLRINFAGEVVQDISVESNDKVQLVEHGEKVKTMRKGTSAPPDDIPSNITCASLATSAVMQKHASKKRHRPTLTTKKAAKDEQAAAREDGGSRFHRQRKSTDGTANIRLLKLGSFLMKKSKSLAAQTRPWSRRSTINPHFHEDSARQAGCKVNLTPISILIGKLVKREFEGNDEKSGNELKLWYDRLRIEGAGHIRFVSQCSGSCQVGADDDCKPSIGSTFANNTAKSFDNCSFSTASGSCDYSSFEVPSVFAELKSLPNVFKVSRTGFLGTKLMQEDDNKGVQFASSRPTCSAGILEADPANTLTLAAVGMDSCEHGFRVELHENRVVCEV